MVPIELDFGFTFPNSLILREAAVGQIVPETGGAADKMSRKMNRTNLVHALPVTNCLHSWAQAMP